MTSLTQQLTNIVSTVFATSGLPSELGQVTLTNRPDLGQFQCNGALAAAKLMRQPPWDIASKIAATLRDLPIFQDISLASPGFINLTLTDDWLTEQTMSMVPD
jgi:arginyl-tRNA synthetase